MRFGKQLRKLTLTAALFGTMTLAAAPAALVAGVSTSPTGPVVAGISTSPSVRGKIAQVKDSHDRYANLAGVSTSPSGPRFAVADIVVTKRIDKTSPRLFLG